MSGCCARSGMCCTLIYLPLLPEELKEQAEKYKENPWDDWGVPARVDEIYNMLKDNFIGKVTNRKGGLYGPCKNLSHTTDENGKTIAVCNIHDNAPGMCQGFPLYGRPESTINPSTYKGCGYNDSPNVGFTAEQTLSNLIKEEDEKIKT